METTDIFDFFRDLQKQFMNNSETLSTSEENIFSDYQKIDVKYGEDLEMNLFKNIPIIQQNITNIREDQCPICNSQVRPHFITLEKVLFMCDNSEVNSY